MNLESYLVDRDCALDEVALYWGGDGKFIDHRPEDVDSITVFGEPFHVSEFQVDFIDEEGRYPKLTISFAQCW